MLNALYNWFVAAFALLLTAYFLPGFRVGNFPSALIIAVVIGFANIFLRPVLIFVTLPINILTLGLFTLVVNGMILKFSAFLLPNFEVRSWSTAIVGSLLVTCFAMIFRFLFGIKS